jgi:hypothetical protein
VTELDDAKAHWSLVWLGAKEGAYAFKVLPLTSRHQFPSGYPTPVVVAGYEMGCVLIDAYHGSLAVDSGVRGVTMYFWGHFDRLVDYMITGLVPTM